MIRFLHSADWQLGAPFSQFGEKGSDLRAVRLKTFERTLEIGRRRKIDLFLIAGDLFQDNQVDKAVVKAAYDLFVAVSDYRILILPGNHDPASGPGSIWERPPFNDPPEHVTVLKRTGVVEVSGGIVIARPIVQKLSTRDPSDELKRFAGDLAEDAIKIGITHGSLRIESKFQPNDHPIRLDGASHAGLDYLALGHWHTWQGYDGGRLVMPGTPEPDQFEQDGAGKVALVEIESPGAVPKVEPLAVASLDWRSVTVDIFDIDNAKEMLYRLLQDPCLDPESTVFRATLQGAATSAEVKELTDWLKEKLQPYLISKIEDETQLKFSEVELQELKEEHPLLAQVAADLSSAAKTVSGGMNPVSDGGFEPLTLSDLREAAEAVQLDLIHFDEDFLKIAGALLLQKLREVE